MERNLYKNLFCTSIIVVVLFISVIISACQRADLNNFEEKVCKAYKIELGKNNINRIYIEKLANIKEDFVLLKVDSKWYVLAINNYDYLTESDKNSDMFKLKGWLVTRCAKVGDYAEAPAILADMAEGNYDRYNYDLTNINKALGLKTLPNV